MWIFPLLAILAQTLYGGDLRAFHSPSGVRLEFRAGVEDMCQFYTLQRPCGFSTTMHGCDFGYVIAGLTYTITIPAWTNQLFFRFRLAPMCE